MGAARLSAAAAELEKAIREGRTEEQPELLARLEGEYELFRKETTAAA